MSGYSYRLEHQYSSGNRQSSSSLNRNLFGGHAAPMYHGGSYQTSTIQPNASTINSSYSKYSYQARERTPEKYPSYSPSALETPPPKRSLLLQLTELDNTGAQSTATSRGLYQTPKGDSTLRRERIGLPGNSIGMSPRQSLTAGRRMSQSFLDQPVGAFSVGHETREHRDSSANRVAQLLESLPPTFDNLKKEGFDIQEIDKEQKINTELLRVGKGLLEMIRAVQTGVEAAKAANSETIKKVLPALDTKLAGGHERLEDTKRRLRDSHKIDLGAPSPAQ